MAGRKPRISPVYVAWMSYCGGRQYLYHPGGCYTITLTSHEHHGVSHHSKIYCLLNSLIWMTSKRTLDCALLVLCVRGSVDVLTNSRGQSLTKGQCFRVITSSWIYCTAEKDPRCLVLMALYYKLLVSVSDSTLYYSISAYSQALILSCKSIHSVKNE